MDMHDDDKKDHLSTENKTRFSEENPSSQYNESEKREFRDRAPREEREFRERAPREEREFRERAPREGREFRDRAPREEREFRDHAPREGREFRDRAPREGRPPRDPNRRPPLRETIMDMDKDILKMLARRCNIIDKMKAKHGYLDPKEEKTLRTSWEKQATQMTRDPRIIRQLFALFQEIEFSAKPQYGDEKRTSFNLAPTKEVLDVSIDAPLVSRRSRLYLSLAGASGSALVMRPGLLSDSDVECIKMFNQCATSLAWDDDGTMRSRQGGGLSLPDKVIFVGDDALNFYLLLGHYVGSVSRAKFTGDSNLKMADFSTLRRFLPALGARLSNAIPSTLGFPLRIECSGVLPDEVLIPSDIEADVVLGLILAAPFWEKPMNFMLKNHPKAQEILEEAISVLEPCGAKFEIQGQDIKISPSTIITPKDPALGMEMSLAAYLLALSAVSHGKVELNGIWPKCQLAEHLQEIFKQCGMPLEIDAHKITSANIDGSVPKNLNVDASMLDARFAPLALALTLNASLRGEQCYLPKFAPEISDEHIQLFIAHLGFEVNSDNLITAIENFEELEMPFTAPSVYWAMAYALCAFAKPHLKLSNPGIVTSLYPQLWNLYNTLPSPQIKKQILEPVDEKPVRRRIIAADQDGIGNGDSNN